MEFCCPSTVSLCCSASRTRSSWVTPHRAHGLDKGIALQQCNGLRLDLPLRHLCQRVSVHISDSMMAAIQMSRAVKWSRGCWGVNHQSCLSAGIERCKAFDGWRDLGPVLGVARFRLVLSLGSPRLLREHDRSELYCLALR